MTPSCWLVSSATVFAIASITSSASSVSTLSDAACPSGGGVELVPVLHPIRTAVSASRLSRLRRSPLHGETPRRGALSAASNAQARQFSDRLRDRVNDFICFPPAGETVARSTWRTRCSGDPVSACLPPTPLHRCIGLRVRSLNDPHDARLRPFNRHTLEPAAASRCEPTHPSPSAC